MFAWLPAALLGMAAWGAEEAHTVPYVPSAAAEGHAGVVRIESRSGVSGEVSVVAVDDAGQRVEAGRLTLGAGAAAEFEIAAMESGNAALGLTGTGPGEGDWRLELSTELDIEARAYARSEGFLTALHDAVLLSGDVELPFFNPGGDARRSVLRLANARGEPAAVSVRGVDDAGVSSGPATVELGPWEARSYAASELESGSAAGLTGSLGDGDGKWRLTLSADRGSAYATNLLLDGSVLSSVPGSMSRGSGGLHRVPLFPPASDGAGRRGVVRVVNRSADSAEVSIEAFDATDRAYEELRLALEADSSAEFDATDLEQGNAEKGLTGSTGPGEGDWWLELRSESDIEVLSYVDTASGPLSALRGTAGVETATGMRYEALLWGESGEVRLLNAGGAPAEVRLSGVDDAGSSGGAVELTLAPWSARTLTATALAEGEAGMLGALGAGSGSWRLRLEADRELDVLSLVRGSGGMLSDVSRRGRPAGAPPRTEVIDATARGRPDLWVTASASEAELSPGEAFELTAAVGNRGGDASATTLRYYRSTDAMIARSDEAVGTDSVAALGALAASAESVELTAPSTAGTYYYGACADAVAEETNTGNNCSAAVAVTVREPPRQPDLVVAAMLSDAELDPGESFTLSATVRNRGGAQAQATTLRYYRSTDAMIARSDEAVGTDSVAALGALAASAESVELTAPSTAGTYYYGACADAVAEETNTGNNCSAAVAVTVREPPRQPDLVVTAMLSDAELDPGESFTLSATVRNRGGAQAQATTLRYHRSTDAMIARSDEAVGTDSVAALGALAASAESVELTAPSTAGTYYYGACADAVAEETNTGNNCSAAVAVTVREPPRQPDLVVTAMLSDAELDPGESFTLSATVRNGGGAQAQATTLRYHRSTDAMIARSDEAVGTDSVAALGALAVSAESVELTAPSTAGTYYYGACVDAVADETETANNCSAAVAVTVSELARRGPDVTMSAWSMVEGSVLSPGTMVRLVGEARNVGHADTDPLVYVHWLHSDDGTITWSDDYLGVNVLRRLELGGVALRTKFVQLPQREDTYYYGLCAAPQLDETDTSNNCSAAVELEVGAGGLLPDLAVTATAEEYTLYPTVTNVGSLRAEPARLIYYSSPDAVKSPDDVPISPKHTLLPSLAPEEKASYREYFSAIQRGVGHPYFYACAGPVAGEKNTDNNCSAVYSMVPIVERELEVSVPRDCPLEVEVCVRDHECVDGDIVRVSVNGTVIYTHEMVAAWHCETASVNVGANKIEAYAVNEWGGKGGCRVNTVNTGALEVRTGLGASGTAWISRKGGISTIRLNVAVGDAGPCTEEGE